MRYNFADGVPRATLDMLQKRYEAVKGLSSKSLYCPVCNHRTIIVYEDACGHIKAKCSRCRYEAIYDIRFKNLADTFDKQN